MSDLQKLTEELLRIQNSEKSMKRYSREMDITRAILDARIRQADSNGAF